jgi:cell division protein FtsN
MAANVTEGRSRVVEALGFWLVTLLICATAGLASYKFGRDWIGDRLGGDVKPVLTSQELATRVGSGQPDPAKADATDTAAPADEAPSALPAAEPPSKPVVEVKPTTPSVEDRQQLRLDERGEEGSTGGEPPEDREPAADEPGANSRAHAPDERAEPDTPKPAETPKPPKEERRAGRPRPEPSIREEKPEPREPSVPTSSGARFVVRAGSFAERGNAERLAAKLRARGYQPYISRITKDGRPYLRVNVASYRARDEAVKLRDELRAGGHSADVASE